MDNSITTQLKIELQCRSLSENEAEIFLRSLGRGKGVSKPIPSRIVGAFKGGELIALAQFGVAIARNERHTVQLFRLIATDTEDQQAIQSVMDFYKSKYRPSDLLAYDLPDAQAQWLGFSATEDGKAYEWFDRTRSYYTYKITASDSDKYYYGVRSLKHHKATLDLALSDRYWGSGGKRFQRWKARHEKGLQKEIISLHATKAEAYRAEKELIGEAWFLDELCLNSIEGGRLLPPAERDIRVDIKNCLVHGESKHKGNTCCKCTLKSIGSLKDCESHGLTYHHGGSCRKCSRAKAMSYSYCSIHGESVIFHGSHCVSCLNLRTSTKQKCSIHGSTTFQGSSCVLCTMKLKTSIKECLIHGESKHYKNACCRCTSEQRVQIGTCSSHGEVTFLDGQCSPCENGSRVTLKNCPVHGETKHIGSTCMSCVSASSIELKECLSHGLVKHLGASCCSCLVERTVSMKECVVHGLTTHQGNSCSSCTNNRLISMRICPIHGETKHRGYTCYRCAQANRPMPEIKDCPIHGEAKHQGNSCAKCRIEKRTHNSKHTEIPEGSCQFC